jgi:hypothetical protein
MGEKLAVALLVLVAAAVPCRAQDTFRSEAGLSYSNLKGDDLTRIAAGVDGTYYFDPLPLHPADTPYDQVQFVERAGSVSANAAWTSTDIEGQERMSNGYDYGAGVQFARPDTFLRAAASAEVLNQGKSRSSGVDIETESKAYQLSLGAYVAKATSVDLNWSRSKTIASSSATIPDLTVDGIALVGQHLEALPGNGHLAITARATQFTLKSEGSPTQTNRDLQIQAIFYPTKLFGLKAGLGIDRGDNDSLEGETYLVGLKTFFTPAVSLSLDYQKFNSRAAGDGFEMVMLRGAMRF